MIRSLIRVLVFAGLSAFLMTGDAQAAFPGTRIRIAIDAGEPYLSNSIAEETVSAIRKAVPDVPVTVLPLSKEEMRAAVASRSIELALTTPFFFRQLGLSDARAVAALIQKRTPDPNRASSIVLLADVERSDITSLRSLSGLHIGLSSQWGNHFRSMLRGAWQAAGFKPEDLRLVNVPADDLAALKALISKSVDVLVLPACRLERAAEHQSFESVDLSALRVVARKSSGDLACAHSVDLYPGPILVATPNLAPSASRRIVAALLSDGPSENGFFWGEATDFASVDETLRSLDLDAYAELRRWSLARLWQDYKSWFFAAIAVLCGLCMHSFLVSWLVRRRTAELSASLLRERRFEARAEQAGKRVRMLERIGLLGQVGSLFAHEMRQPLSVIAIYAYGLRRMIERGAARENDLLDGLLKIEAQTSEAEAIVAKVRSYLKRSVERKSVESLEVLVRNAVRTFEASGKRRSEISIRNECQAPTDKTPPGTGAQPIPLVLVDAMEIELVLLNLLRNAEEAQTAGNVKQPAIAIRIGIEEAAQSGNAYIIVTDNGPSIDDEAFAAFSARLTAMESTKADGLGLGLSIVRALVEAQGGSVSFERSASGSLAVTIRLPLPEPDLPGKNAQKPAKRERTSEGSA